MLAIGAEGQPEKVGLMSGIRQAGIGEVIQLVGSEIQNRDGLMCLVACVP